MGRDRNRSPFKFESYDNKNGLRKYLEKINVYYVLVILITIFILILIFGLNHKNTQEIVENKAEEIVEIEEKNSITEKIMFLFEDIKDLKDIKKIMSRLYSVGGFTNKKTYLKILEDVTNEILKKDRDYDPNFKAIIEDEILKFKEEKIDLKESIQAKNFSEEILFKMALAGIYLDIYEKEDLEFEKGSSAEKYFKSKEDILNNPKNAENLKIYYDELNILKNILTKQKEDKEKEKIEEEKKNTSIVNYIVDSVVFKRQRVKNGELLKYIEIPEKEGYEFLQWDYDMSKEITKDTNISPIWVKKEDLKDRIIVRFDLDGGEGKTSSILSKKGKTLKEILKEHGYENPTKEDNIFISWNIPYDKVIDENIVLKAIWEKEQN